MLFVFTMGYSQKASIKIHSDYENTAQLNIYKLETFTKDIFNIQINKGSSDHEIAFVGKGFCGISIKFPSHTFTSRIFMNSNSIIDINISEKGEVSFTGDKAEINKLILKFGNLIYKNEKKYSLEDPFNKVRCERYIKSYNAVLDIIKNSGVTETDADILTGYAQFNLLNAVYSPVINSKVFGKIFSLTFDSEYSEPMKGFQPNEFISLFPQWYDNMKELLFTQINCGVINIKNQYSWIADMSEYIQNKSLKTAFIIESLKKDALMSYFNNFSYKLDYAKKSIDTIKYRAILDTLYKKSSLYKSATGTYMGDMVFKDRSGKTVSLKQYEGKYVFLDFWSTGCNPCIGEMPYLKQLEHEFEGRPIVFVSVSFDNKTDIWLSYLEKNGNNGEQLIDTNGFKNPIVKILGIRGIPQFTLLDPSGRVLNQSTYRPSNPILKRELEIILQNK